MSRLSRDKYFPPGGNDFVDELLRRNETLERRINDLERALMNQDTPVAIPRVNPLTYPDPYEGQRAIDPADEQHMWYSDGEWRKAGGLAIYEIKVFEDQNDVISGDGAFYWPIPEDLDAGEIVAVEAGVSTPSSSVAVQIQIAHSVGDANGPWTDILSTKISIDVGEFNSADAATPPVISGGVYTVAHKDWLRIDVDAAGVGAKGLALMVTIAPSPLGSVLLQGSQGPPGGITNWTGGWTTSTVYVTGDAVSNNGSSYVAIQNHTSGTTTEPGVGANWEDYWMLLASPQQTSECLVTIDGSGYPIDVGEKAAVPIYFACTIAEATILGDIGGNAVVDIWKDTYGSYPPTDADSITGSSPPTLTGVSKSTDTTLTGWTTAIAAGDILLFNVDSCSGIRRLTISLKLLRI